jgi:hypothetical protein
MHRYLKLDPFHKVKIRLYLCPPPVHKNLLCLPPHLVQRSLQEARTEAAPLSPPRSHPIYGEKRFKSFNLNPCCGSGSASMRIRIQGFDGREKNYSWKNIIFFDKKIPIYFSLVLSKERPSYRRSLRPSKENTNPPTLEYLRYCGLFLSSWIRIQPTKMNADPVLDPQY